MITLFVLNLGTWVKVMLHDVKLSLIKRRNLKAAEKQSVSPTSSVSLHMESNWNIDRRRGSMNSSRKYSVKFSLEAIEEEKKIENDSEFESTPKIVVPQ